MDLDLRIPVGLLFVTLGLIMTVFGLTSDPALYHKSLGINVNLYWGIVELLFGSLMIAFGRSASRTSSVAAPNPVPAAASGKKAVTTRHGGPPRIKPPVRHG